MQTRLSSHAASSLIYPQANSAQISDSIRAHIPNSECMGTAQLWGRSVRESRQVSEGQLMELISNVTLDEGVLYEVNHSLTIADCDHLHSLSGNISVEKGLFIRNCPNLRNLSANLFVKRGIYINQCPRLERVDGSIFCDDNFIINRAKNLIDLTADVCIKHLYLLECSKLKNISGTINVEHDLDINRCNSLTDLTGKITVGGNLSLGSCRQLTNLSGMFSVGGDIDFSDCIRLTSLPDWILSLGNKKTDHRTINLNDTGFLKMEVDEIRSAAAPGMEFLFDESEVSGENFQEFDQAFLFWRELASSTAEIPKLDLTWSQECDLVNFLEALTECDDYINESTRLALARRVVGVMTLLPDGQMQERVLKYISSDFLASYEAGTFIMNDLEILAQSCAGQSLPPQETFAET